MEDWAYVMDSKYGNQWGGWCSNQIKFWHDSWCGELPLRVQFPELFRLARVMPRGVADLFACWSGKVGNSESGAIWKAVPHCLMWCSWRERNSRTFSEESNRF
uniref:Reverse transcriptase zinc-binding domain-containing protein n=1 Tax=Fagus sylvatica TaxID=28930 RepID=A0A2N9I2M2_FAGSY